MRFLHLADVHLDTLFAGRSDGLRTRLRQASREAFAGALEWARKEAVDAVLLAGDLFDGDRLSLASERFLLDSLRELEAAGIPFLYATGNHDPSEARSAPGSATGRLAWPKGVHLFGAAEPRTIEVRSRDRLVGTVTAAGHENSREDRDLSRAFRPPPGATVPALALLHTQVGGARGDGEHDRYAPSELAFLREAGFDYWALGHIHLRQALETHPGIHFPGNLQGRSPRETGAKGGLLVELPGRGLAPDVEFVEFAPVRWEELVVSDLAEAAGLEPLLRQVEGAWSAVRREDPGRSGTEWVVRVRLTGPSPLNRQLSEEEEREVLAQELTARLGALEVDVVTGELRPALDATEALERQDAAGAALRMVRTLRDPGGPSPSRALGIDPEELGGFDRGLGGVAGETDAEAGPLRDALDRYLRELLEGGEAELLERFIEEGEGSG
jgi:DNA repair protein SbcD/Mre11